MSIKFSACNSIKDPSSIYAGINGNVRDVKSVYVGNSNNEAVKVWGQRQVNSRFLLINGDGYTYYSIDGETWNLQNEEIVDRYTTSYYSNYPIVYGNGKYVYIGPKNTKTKKQYLYTSLDGLGWNVENIFDLIPNLNTSYHTIIGLSFINNKFVFDASYNGSSMDFYITHDFAEFEWTNNKKRHSSVTPIRFISDGKNLMIGLASSIKMAYYSIDGGDNWYYISADLRNSLSSTSIIRDCLYKDGEFILLVNNMSKLFISSDLVNWHVKEIPYSGFNKLIYAQDKYMFLGGDKICYSNDLINFIKVEGIEFDNSASLADIVYGNDRFVVVNGKSKSYYSLDGANWKPMEGLETSTNITTNNSLVYGEI